MLNEIINMEDGYVLAYKKPECFSKYHNIYYCGKYSNYFFRDSLKDAFERTQYLDSGHLIYKDNKIVGGLFIKPNFMADFFIISPFNDYEVLIEKLLKYLKTISILKEKIIIQDVVEELVPFYEKNNCTIFEKGFWMIRNTENINCIIPKEYELENINDSNKVKIAEVIINSYSANPAMKNISKKQEYIEQIERFFKYTSDKPTLYESSKVIKLKDTKEIIGVIMYMEYENNPLIMELAVEPKYQGKGIGSILLKNSINKLNRNYQSVRLFVHEGNVAIKLYEKLSFAKNKSLNNLYLK